MRLIHSFVMTKTKINQPLNRPLWATTQATKENQMKPTHFIYSKQQESIVFDFEPEIKRLVYINGSWVKYTEINSTGDSNFEDAVHLGIHPSCWVMLNGVIQDTDLANFINNASN